MYPSSVGAPGDDLAATLLDELGQALAGDPPGEAVDARVCRSGGWQRSVRRVDEAAPVGDRPAEALDQRVRALVSGPEPLVALALAVTPHDVTWVKSRGPMSPLELELSLHRWAHEAEPFSLAASAGGAHLPGVPVARPPTLALGDALRLGRPSLWAQVDALSLFVLALPARAVSVGRGRLWRLRPEHALALEPRAREVLTRARTGRLRLEPRGAPDDERAS